MTPAMFGMVLTAARERATILLVSPLFALLLLVSVVLAGCGESGVGSGGTGVPEGSQIGTVTGFGSVIVDTNRYETDSASVSVEQDPTNPLSADIGAVELGMQVQVQYRNTNQATSIRVMPALVGRVQRVAADQLGGAGQTIQVTDDSRWTTVFEGFDQLADLDGTLVRVFGQTDQAGFIVATRIERLFLGVALPSLVTGVVTEVSSASEFRLGALTVRSDSQTALAPSDAQIEVGALVTVVHRTESVTSEVLATRVVVRSTSDLENEVRIAGLIRQSDGAGQFSVGWVRIDAKSAEVTGGTLADLTAGALVRIAGNRDGRILVANTVEVISSLTLGQNRIEGEVSDYFSVRSFRVRGAPVDARNATLIGGQEQNLGDGTRVRVSGRSVAGVLIASSIELVNPDGGTLPDFSGNPRTISGPAYLIQPIARRLYVNRVVVSWNTQTTIIGDLAGLSGGQNVVVTGVVDGDELAASRIEVVPN